MSGGVIGIFGGSFSPPHLGHTRALTAFIAQERLDCTYVIPTLVPPHKTLGGDATPEERLEMCRLAFSHLPVTVSDREIRRGGKSYTVLTLEELKTEDNRLVFLCGTDMLLTLEEWHLPARIFELAEIVYVCRETGEEGQKMAARLHERAEEYRQKYGAILRPLSVDEVIDISSTEIRAALAEGGDTAAYLATPVKEYIEKCHLYGR